LNRFFYTHFCLAQNRSYRTDGKLFVKWNNAADLAPVRYSLENDMASFLADPHKA